MNAGVRRSLVGAVIISNLSENESRNHKQRQSSHAISQKVVYKSLAQRIGLSCEVTGVEGAREPGYLGDEAADRGPKDRRVREGLLCPANTSSEF